MSVASSYVPRIFVKMPREKAAIKQPVPPQPSRGFSRTRTPSDARKGDARKDNVRKDNAQKDDARKGALEADGWGGGRQKYTLLKECQGFARFLQNTILYLAPSASNHPASLPPTADSYTLRYQVTGRQTKLPQPPPPNPPPDSANSRPTTPPGILQFLYTGHRLLHKNSLQLEKPVEKALGRSAINVYVVFLLVLVGNFFWPPVTLNRSEYYYVIKLEKFIQKSALLKLRN